MLEEAKRKNKRLGFGDNRINWERRRYERDRRNMIKKGKIWAKQKALAEQAMIP